ncbi:MAG: hypothetical protein LBM98_02060 [Oscillospiraceae bacterium]|nr:hypothetical protein [Oscillospiraceae bacterium]
MDVGCVGAGDTPRPSKEGGFGGFGRWLRPAGEPPRRCGGTPPKRGIGAHTWLAGLRAYRLAGLRLVGLRKPPP